MGNFDLRSIRHSITTRKAGDAKKESLFSELHSLLLSGLDFSHSFRLLIEGESDEKFRKVIKGLYQKVVSGGSLWQALEASGRFTALDSGVVRIGEETGRLTDSLQFLADYYQKKLAQKRMVSSAVSYPLIILCVAIIVVVFMMLVIVPMFEQVYSRMGGELPALTQWIISASKTFPRHFTVFLLLSAALAASLRIFREKQTVRAVTSAVLLRIPLAGNIIKKSNQSHFCKLLYLLTSSGVPLLYGLGMLEKIITFYPYQLSFGRICESLHRGELFSENLGKFPALYDRKLVTLLMVGEETNRLPEMLKKQGDDIAADLEHRLRQLGNYLEPLLILFVGILVAVILVSMYMPMFKLGNIMG